MSRVKYRSPELMHKRRRTVKRVTIVSLVGCILLAVGLIFFLRMERFQIREVSVTGVQIIEESDIHDFANESLAGSYLWVIPKTNTFIYSVRSLERELLEAYPGILSLNVKRDGLQKISISIEERKPHALWCAEANEGDVPDCFFVDTTGLVFAKAPYFSGNVYFVFRGKLDSDVPLGSHILDPQDFSDFEQFISLITNTLHVEIVSVLFKDLGDFDLFLPSGVRVMLNSKLSYDDMFNNFSSLIQSSQFASTTLTKLEYIDMRFGNKIYLKNKEEQK